MSEDSSAAANLPARKIALKFGSNNAMARALGKNQSTTYRWHREGYIPGAYQRDVIRAARAAGFELTPADFVNLSDFEPTE